MGCGCGQRNTMPRRIALRPTIGPKAIQGGTAATANPALVRAVGMQNNLALGQARRMDEQRLMLEKLRRDAIQKRLNK